MLRNGFFDDGGWSDTAATPPTNNRSGARLRSCPVPGKRSSCWRDEADSPNQFPDTTETPAKLLGHADLGSLKPGSAGDAAVLKLRAGRFDDEDVEGVREVGTKRLFRDAVVVRGALYHEPKDAAPGRSAA